jgi:ribosomal protein S18 acetylase RimI-like enzyme
MTSDTSEIEIRTLAPEDASAFRALRLRALLEDPIPFLSSYEEEADCSVEDVAIRLRASDPATRVLGAFRHGALVGTLGSYRHALLKARHRANLWGMYVAPEERQRGIGNALLSMAIKQLRALGDIEQIELTVVTSAHAARNLYRAAGFQCQGLLRRAMKTGNGYFDEELLVRWFEEARSTPAICGASSTITSS